MAWVQKLEGSRGVRYKVGYRDLNRRLRYRTFSRRREAEAYKASVEHSMHSGRTFDSRRGDVRLAEYWPEFWRTSKPRAESTQSLYEMHARLHILPYLGSWKLNSIGRADVKSWMADLRDKGVGEPTVNAAHRLLRRVLAVAFEDGILPDNPAAGIKAQSPPRSHEIRPVKLSELKALAEAVDERYRVLVLVLGLCGLRIGEASALRVRDVKLPEGKLSIIASATEVSGRRIVKETKTGKARSVALPSFLSVELRDHIIRYSQPLDPDALVFTTSTGTPIRQKAFRSRVFQLAARRADIEPIPRVHDLRHTAVALAIEQGATPEEIQERVGHSSIRVTLDIYGHVFEGIQDRLAERLDAAYRALDISPRKSELRLGPDEARSNQEKTPGWSRLGELD